MDDADIGLPTILEQFLQNATLIIISILVIAIIFPYFLLALGPLMLIYYVVVGFSRPAQVLNIIAFLNDACNLYSNE